MIRKLLIIPLLLLYIGVVGQRKEPDLGVHVFYYNLDSVWAIRGHPDTPATELWKQGTVTSHKSYRATVEIHLSQDDKFRDHIIFKNPLLKLSDTLYIKVQSHLAGHDYVSLLMFGWLKVNELGNNTPEYRVFYVINHTPKLIANRFDSPQRRTIYFITRVDNRIIPKK